jgi:hypothetical protein
MKPKNRTFAQVFIAALAIVVIFGCDPAKRLQRICRNNPGVCQQDSVTHIIKDSVIIAAVQVDTTFQQTADTVYITKDHLVIKYRYNPVNNQVYISGYVAEQKHVFEHKITVVNTGVKFKKDWLDYISHFFSFISGMLVMLPIIKWLLNKLKIIEPAKRGNS